MPSTVYKTFMANPGMATLPTPKAHNEATLHQPKAPQTNPQCTPVICQAFSRRKDDPAHTDIPQCTPSDHSKAKPDTPKAESGMSHTHFRSHSISSSNRRGRSRMLKKHSHYNFNPLPKAPTQAPKEDHLPRGEKRPGTSQHDLDMYH